MTPFFLTIILAAAAAVVPAQDEKAEPGRPFGPISEADFEHLQATGKKAGFDLQGEVSRLYGGEKKSAEKALGRLFQFSLSLTAFDQDARAYGTLIVTSLDRIGEPMGVGYYVKLLERQPASVQQRIRDFLFYPSSLALAEDRADALAGYHKVYPTLFRADYEFARGDSLFVAQDYLPDFSFTIGQAGNAKDLTVSVTNVSGLDQEFVDTLVSPVPEFGFQCQFGKRDAEGKVSSLSDPLTLNIREEHNPAPPAPLSTLAPGGKHQEVIQRACLLPRIDHALSMAPPNMNFDSVRFLIVLPVNQQITRFITAKSPFFALSDYVTSPSAPQTQPMANRRPL